MFSKTENKIIQIIVYSGEGNKFFTYVEKIMYYNFFLIGMRVFIIEQSNR